MKSSRLIVDVSNAAHRISAATHPLTTSKGERIEVIFTLLKMLSAMLRQNRSTDCFLVWDLPTSKNLRKHLDPLYKSKRDNKTPDDEARLTIMYEQMQKFVADFLPILPVTWCESPKYEADDIIAWLCHTTDAPCVIVSGDKDMLQLVSSRVSVYSPNTDKTCTLGNFQDYTKGYPNPQAYLFSRCLSGDPSDSIPGIPKVGEVTARKWMAQHGWSLGDLLDRPSEDLKKSSVGQSILSDEGRARIALNYMLMALHGPAHTRPGGKLVQHLHLTQGTLSTKQLKERFMKRQFVSLLANFAGFVGPFLSLAEGNE